VTGEQPTAELEHRLRGILAAGAPGALPEEVVTTLRERGRQMRRRGLWSEGHCRA
jgi:hypothetical protein